MTRPLTAALVATLLAAACTRGRVEGGGGGSSASTVWCPTAPGGLPPAPPAALIIDDFGDGPAGGAALDGRTRAGAGFAAREQFLATPAARFDPPPRLDVACPGTAHIKGTPADTGATFTVVFSSGPDGGTPARFYDASARKGISFRAALGRAGAPSLYTLQVNLADSKWSYTKDFVVDGTSWRRIDIPWSALTAVSGAPPFSPATLNQIVFPLPSGAPIDLFLDDLAFMP